MEGPNPVTFKSKLCNSNVFSNVMQYFDTKELIEMRNISGKFADEYVPKNINELRYECEEDYEDDPYEFPKRIRNAKKVIIRNICGTVDHVKKIEEIGKN